MTNRIGVMVDSFRVGVSAGLERAKALGAGAVQMYVGEPREALDSLWTPAFRREVKQRAADLGLTISAICADLGGYEFEKPEEHSWRVPETLRRVDFALEMGCRVLTTHIGVIPSDKSHPRFDILAQAMGPLGEYAQSAGAMLAIETGPELPEVLLSFIETLRGGVGVNHDPANLVMVHGIDPIPGIKILSKYIVHTHAKDGRMLRYVGPETIYHYFAQGGIGDLRMGECFIETPLGQGDVDMAAWLKALDEVGYQGYVTIEREAGATPEKDIGEAVRYLKGLGL